MFQNYEKIKIHNRFWRNRVLDRFYVIFISLFSIRFWEIRKITSSKYPNWMQFTTGNKLWLKWSRNITSSGKISYSKKKKQTYIKPIHCSLSVQDLKKKRCSLHGDYKGFSPASPWTKLFLSFTKCRYCLLETNHHRCKME